MEKKFLFTPGPTPVPPSVLEALSRPVLHHRKPVFKAILGEVEQDLKWLFQTKNEVLVLTASGTGGMEGAFSNFFSPGDKLINISTGKFGERWTKMAKAFGLNVVELAKASGESVTADEVSAMLKAHPDARGVCMVASETSTGAYNPVQEVAALVRETPAILIVDAITALGVHDMKLDEWGVDICVTGSQKALMLPPGLAFASVSEKAWELNKTAKCPRFYFDWAKERKAIKEPTTAYTSPTSQVVALHEALRLMKEETLQGVFDRHTKLAHATREAMKALGLTLFAKTPANSVTSVVSPEGISAKALVKQWDKAYGCILAAGQDELEEKIFRVSHIGYFVETDILQCIAVIEMGLADFGYPVELGKGVGTAAAIFRKGKA